MRPAIRRKPNGVVLREALGLTVMLALVFVSGPARADAAIKNLKTDFGAVGDGVANDCAALNNALSAMAGGGVLIVPTGTYSIVGGTGAVISNDVMIVGAGSNSVFRLNGGSIAICSTSIVTQLSSAALPGAAVIRVNKNAALQAGRILRLTCDVVAENSWSLNKQDIHKIEAVADAGGGLADVTLGAPLNFGYSPSEPGHAVTVYFGPRFILTGVNVEIAAGGGLVQLTGLRGACIGNLKVRQTNGLKSAQSILWGYCVDGTMANVALEGMMNGAVYSCCRNMRMQNIAANNCEQPFIVSYFSDSLYFNNLTGVNGGMMDSHPAFDLHFANVRATDLGISNLRSCGGSIRDSVFTSLCTNGQTYFQNLFFSTNVLAAGDPYADREFIVENVEWNTAIKSSSVSLHSSLGRRAIFRNVKTGMIYFPVYGGVDEVYLSDCTLGYLYTREYNLNVQSTRFDGALYSTNLLAGLGAWQYNAVFMDCVFTNAAYVIPYDYVYDDSRHFIRCSFEDISVRFDNMPYPDLYYTYEFDDCDFVRVAGYGASLSESTNVEVDNCSFTPGYPVLGE